MARLGRRFPAHPLIERIRLATPQALSGAIASATWTCAVLSLALGAVALSGASASTTWTPAAIDLSDGSVALTGTSPATTWTVASIDLPQTQALSGVSPVATWACAAIGIHGGGVTTLDDLTTLFSFYVESVRESGVLTGDTETRVSQDRATIRAAESGTNDINTAYAVYLTPLF